MTCNINSKEKEGLIRSGVSKDTIKQTLNISSSMNEVERNNVSFNEESLFNRALNIKDITYNGKKVNVLKANIVTGIPDSTRVTFSMLVGNKYVEEEIIENSAYNPLNISINEIVKLKSSINFVFNAQGNARALAHNITTTPERMLELVEDIRDRDVDLSPAYKNMLDNALRNVVKPLSTIVPKMTVMLEEEAENTGGGIKLTKIGDSRSGLIEISKSGKKNQMSAYEAYVHEIYHAVIEWVLTTPEGSGLRREAEEMRDTFLNSKKAQKVFKDNLPDQENADKDFEDLLDYFTDPVVGIQEFITYSGTNMALQKALEVNSTRVKKDIYPTLASKMIAYIRKIFRAMTDTVLKRPEGNDNTQMAWVIEKLVQANEKQVREKKNTLFSKIVNKMEDLDSLAAKAADKVKGKDSGVSFTFGNSKFGVVAGLPINIVRGLYNDNIKKSVAAMASFMGMSLNSTIPTIIRQGLKDSDINSRAQQFGMINNSHDSQREAIRSNIRLKLKENFNIDIGVRESLGLGVLLDTDYSSIQDKHKLEDLLDSTKLTDKIKKVKAEIKSKTDDKGYRYFLHQSKLLSEYMVKGTTNILLLKNANNIAMRINSVDNIQTEPDPEMVALIDELVSLEAFQTTSLVNRKTLKEVLEKENEEAVGKHGIEELMFIVTGLHIKAQENLFKEDGMVSQQIKGYKADVFPEDLDVIVAPLADAEKLKKEGYELMIEVHNHKNDRSGKQGMFKSKLPIKNRMHKVGMRYKNSTARGSSFTDGYYKDNSQAALINAKTDIHKTRNEMYKKVREVEEGIYKKDIDDEKIAPRFSENGTVLDFNYSMTVEQKRKLLGADTDIFKIIGSTAANNFDKRISKEHNAEVAKLIIEESKHSSPSYRGDKILGKKNNEVYIWIGPNSKNEKNKELWQVLPDEVKALFRSQEKNKLKDPDGFYVQESLVSTLLGFRENSIIDFPIFNKFKGSVKYGLQVAEEIQKSLVRIYKSQILLRMPEVLITNVLSNFFSSLFYLTSPIKIAKYQLQAVKELDNYINLTKEKILLEIKVESGKANKKEQRDLNIIINKMNNSSVKDLVDVGFYNQIIEDIENGETNNIVKKKIGEQADKLPTIIKNGLDHVWLPDSHPITKFMEASTQYSDFVARYALYNVLTKEKGKTKDEAVKTVRNLFINYTNPNSPFLEWANSMGAVMFTKYFTNIQKAIGELVEGHPISFVLFMLGQGLLFDVPDITDSSIVTKDLTNLFYSPVEGAMNSVLPGTYVMADNLLR